MDPDEPDGEDEPRKKGRTRQNFTWRQVSILEQVFDADPRPRQALRSALANKLGIHPRCVQVWFQNRRQRYKAMHQAMGQTAPPLQSTMMSATQLLNLEKSNPQMAALVDPNNSARGTWGKAPPIGGGAPAPLVPGSGDAVARGAAGEAAASEAGNQSMEMRRLEELAKQMRDSQMQLQMQLQAQQAQMKALHELQALQCQQQQCMLSQMSMCGFAFPPGMHVPMPTRWGGAALPSQPPMKPQLSAAPGWAPQAPSGHLTSGAWLPPGVPTPLLDDAAAKAGAARLASLGGMPVMQSGRGKGGAAGATPVAPPSAEC
jgi:TolA-binding protein